MVFVAIQVYQEDFSLASSDQFGNLLSDQRPPAPNIFTIPHTISYYIKLKFCITVHQCNYY